MSYYFSKMIEGGFENLSLLPIAEEVQQKLQKVVESL